MFYRVFQSISIVIVVAISAQSSDTISSKLYESTESKKSHFPNQLTGLSYVKSLAGGTGGVHVLKNQKGHLFTLKCAPNAEQAKEEILADGLYRSLGIPVPAFAVYDRLPPNNENLNRLCEGPGPYRLADFIPSGENDPKKIQEEMKKHFVVDAFLSNWDVVINDLHEGYKNVILDPSNTLWRIDNGGSLRYRALGEKRVANKTWDPFKVLDLDSLRNHEMNPDGAQVYGALTNDDLKQQAQQIYYHREKLFNALDEITFALHITNPPELKEMLRRRLDDLAQRFKLTAEWTPKKNTAKTHQEAREDMGAGVLVYGKDPKTGKLSVLLGKRIRHNWWGNFGGKSDTGLSTKHQDKTLADTAIREVKEESFGLLHFSPIQLTNSPSHDILNQEGFLYRMYITPHRYIAPDRLLEAEHSPESEQNKWDAEYSAYQWIPLDELLQGLKDNQLVEEEGQKTLKIKDMLLHPPFAEMLQEREVQEVLTALNEGKKIHPRHTVRQGDAPPNLPLTLEEEKEGLAETVTRHGAVIAELKEKQRKSDPPQKVSEMRGYLSDDEAKQIRHSLQTAPYSQTEAYFDQVMGKKNLQRLQGDARKQVNTFLSTYSKFPLIAAKASQDYKNALTDALSAEKEGKLKEKAVFYHAADPMTCFLYDLLSAFRAQLKMVSPANLKVFRGMDHPFVLLKDVNDFIEHYKNDQGFVDNYAHIGGFHYADMGLSVNLFLFGNDGMDTSCTYYLFYTMNSVVPIDLEKFVNAFMAQTGIPGNFKDYKAIYEQYYQEYESGNAKLFQIFIDPQVVDAVSYAAISRGELLSMTLNDGSKYHGFAKVLPEIRTNPSAFSQRSSTNLNELQGRLFLKPEVFHDPRHVTVQSYWHHQPSSEIESSYQKSLNDQIKYDLSRWLAESVSVAPHVLGEETPALRKLYQYVYEGKTGLKYTEKEAIKLLISAVAQADFNMAQRVLKQNPKINVNDQIKIHNYREEKETSVSLISLLPYDTKDHTSVAAIINLLFDTGLVMNDDILKMTLNRGPEFLQAILSHISDDNKSILFKPLIGDSNIIRSLFQYFIGWGHVDKARLILESCLNNPNALKQAFCFQKCKKGISIDSYIYTHAEIIQVILDMYQKNPESFKTVTPQILVLAVFKGNSQLVKTLLDHNPRLDPNQKAWIIDSSGFGNQKAAPKSLIEILPMLPSDDSQEREILQSLLDKGLVVDQNLLNIAMKRSLEVLKLALSRLTAPQKRELFTSGTLSLRHLLKTGDEEKIKVILESCGEDLELFTDLLLQGRPSFIEEITAKGNLDLLQSIFDKYGQNDALRHKLLSLNILEDALSNKKQEVLPYILSLYQQAPDLLKEPLSSPDLLLKCLHLANVKACQTLVDIYLNQYPELLKAGLSNPLLLKTAVRVGSMQNFDLFRFILDAYQSFPDILTTLISTEGIVEEAWRVYEISKRGKNEAHQRRSIDIFFLLWDAAAQAGYKSQTIDMRQVNTLLLPKMFKDAQTGKIATLDLSNQPLNEETLNSLVETLKESPAITSLVLHHCDLTDRAFITLGNALKNNKTLLRLDLSDNQKITNESAKGFCRDILPTMGLKHLNLSGTKVDSEGPDTLEYILGQDALNSPLESFEFAHNNLMGADFEDLASTTALKNLNLGHNDINEQNHSTGNLFPGWLHINPHIEQLNLSGNKMTDQDASELATILKKGNALKVLDLGENLITEKGRQEIREALKDNPGCEILF